MATDSSDIIDILTGGNESAKTADSPDTYTDILPPPPSPSNPASNPQAGSFSFSGRARRSTYWGVGICIGLIAGVICGISGAMAGSGADVDPSTAILLGLLIGLPLWLWGLATEVRRCHDIGWSGWRVVIFWLIGFIPFVGWIAASIFFIFLGFADSQPFTNQYGPDPKGRNLTGEQPQRSSQPPPASKPQQLPLGDQLRELKKLLDDGILTQEEFDAQKAKILASDASSN